MTFMPIVASVRHSLVAESHRDWPEAVWQAAGALGLMFLGSSMLLRSRRHLRGTTLLAPAIWAAGSLLAIGGTELGLLSTSGGAASDWAEPLRFAAAMSLFCPTMAVLGAKRPQDKAWQFIVVSLWIVLALPSGEWLLQSGGEAFEIHPARSWFLAILIAIGTVNVLATRFWPSGLLLFVGQLVLLGGYLPLVPRQLPEAIATLVGLGLCIIALALVIVGWPARAAVTLPLDRVWLDFRDMFGAVWGLRIVERLNASARVGGWDVQLRWNGFCKPSGEPVGQLAPDQAAQIEDASRTLLRRFVSPEWIAARLDHP